MTPGATPAHPAAANPYAPPASAPAPGHKQCDSCGADILAKAEICPKCGVRQHSHVSKAVLLLVTFFFGGLGAHKFYLGKWWQGALYLIFFWTWIPALIALVEFIVYCFTSEDRLNEKYSAHGTAALVIVIVAVFFGVAMIGILAAVAIPAYQDYTHRARSAAAQQASILCAWEDCSVIPGGVGWSSALRGGRWWNKRRETGASSWPSRRLPPWSTTRSRARPRRAPTRSSTC